MPFKKLTIKPGVDVEQTQTLRGAGWAAGNLIRFREGLPEKIGGWVQVCASALIGVCRTLHSWADLSGTDWIAAGTTQRLQVIQGGALSDITPIIETDNVSSAFSTTSGSPAVKFTDASYTNGNVGDWVNIVCPVAIGGLVLQGLVQLTSTSPYAFTASESATATVSSGGSTPLFTTSSGSDFVTTTLVNNGLTTGQSFSVQISTTVGGITLEGEYVATSILNSSNFSFNAGGAATATASAYENSDQARFAWLLPSGEVSDTQSGGYGVGFYGVGPYGVAGSQTTTEPARIWSLDHFGQDLIAAPLSGGVYMWSPSSTVDTPATLISGAPSAVGGIFCSMPQEIVVAWAASAGSGTEQTPLLVRWSDQADFTDWVATVTNQAGSFTLPRGSKIIAGLATPNIPVLFTDIDLWGMQYEGQPFIWGFLQIGNNCGLIAQNAAVVVAGTLFWMSNHGPFMFQGGGGAQPIPCPVWDTMFYNLDTSNEDKIIAAANVLFNEVSWFYPSLSGGTGEIDSYIKFNFLENVWDYGSLVRTAWTDQGPPGPPLGVDDSGLVQEHEQGFDANGSAMTGVYIQSGYMDLEDGTLFVFVDQLIPDLKWQGANQSVNVTLYFLNWPGDAPTTIGPITVSSSQEYITLRTRARQWAIKVESDNQGVWWRWGAPRMRMATAGRV